MTATGCSITSEATVSAAGATGCFIFRATFFTGAALGLALAIARFAVLAILRVLLRLAEFARRSLARPCTFDRFLRLAMITPFWSPRGYNRPSRGELSNASYQQIAA